MAKVLTTGSQWLWLDNADPGTSETNVSVGNLWLNTSSNNMFICKVQDLGAQIWDRYPIAPISVPNGGTGRTSLTDHAVLVGNGTDGVTQLALGSANSILMGQTSDDPVFTTSGTPYVAGISFDNGSNTLGAYVGLSSFTPVLAGTGTAGTATYTSQIGRYMRIGSLIFGWINLAWNSTDGAGNTLITGLPVAANAAVTSVCNFTYAGITLGAGGLGLVGQISGTQIAVSNTITNAALLPLVLPASGTLQTTFMYSV
jgi:hypothetical protein